MLGNHLRQSPPGCVAGPVPTADAATASGARQENRSARGGYVLQEAEGGARKLTILSTGSELHLAVEARKILQKRACRLRWCRCRAP